MLQASICWTHLAKSVNVGKSAVSSLSSKPWTSCAACFLVSATKLPSDWSAPATATHPRLSLVDNRYQDVERKVSRVDTRGLVVTRLNIQIRVLNIRTQPRAPLSEQPTRQGWSVFLIIVIFTRTV